MRTANFRASLRNLSETWAQETKPWGFIPVAELLPGTWKTLGFIMRKTHTHTWIQILPLSFHLSFTASTFILVTVRDIPSHNNYWDSVTYTFQCFLIHSLEYSTITASPICTKMISFLKDSIKTYSSVSISFCIQKYKDLKFTKWWTQKSSQITYVSPESFLITFQIEAIWLFLPFTQAVSPQVTTSCYCLLSQTWQ